MTALIKNSTAKRCVSIILMTLVFAMILSIAQGVSAAEADTKIYGSFEYVVEDGAVCITKYNGAGGDVAIPDTIDNKTVSSIGDEAFWYRSDVTAVDLPSDLEYIGARAFQGCSMLATIALPDTVREIGDACFSDCTELVSVNVPSNLLYVGGFAFDNTPWITRYSDNTSIIFGDTVYYKYLGDAETVVIPDGITGISSNAFEGKTDLKYVSIPDSTLFIGDYCFLNCENLKGLSFPDGIYFIGGYCFGYKTVQGQQEPELYDDVTVYASKEKLGATYAKDCNIKFMDISQAPTPDELPEAESCTTKPYVTKKTENTGWFKNKNSLAALIIIVVSCAVIIGGVTVVLTINEKKNKKNKKQAKTDNKKSKKKKKK